MYYNIFQQQLRGITIKLEAKHLNLFLKTFKKSSKCTLCFNL